MSARSPASDARAAADGSDDLPDPLDGRRRSILDPRGRRKAYRPLPPGESEAAVARGLAAYARGDFYLAHEELEPAWMAADDTGDRERLAGLIKLAAAFVHSARGNPAGVATNLRGARERLAGAEAAGADGGLDLASLGAAIDERLDRVTRMEATPPPAASAASIAHPSHDVAGPPARAQRPPLDLDPPVVTWRTRS
jgi:Domain of unknown function (DUF309)